MINLNRIIAGVLLITLSPILLISAIIIFIDDGSPIIFKQKRVGKNNKIFYIYKLRTMKKNIGDIPTHLLKNSTGLFLSSGEFFRKLSIDELPQLYNVIKSEMTFIGPRPALHNQGNLIDQRKKKGVNLILPGITGWAQVNGRDDLSIKRKVELDQFYYTNKCLSLDLKILLMTILKVLKSDGVR